MVESEGVAEMEREGGTGGERERDQREERQRRREEDERAALQPCLPLQRVFTPLFLRAGYLPSA